MAPACAGCRPLHLGAPPLWGPWRSCPSCFPPQARFSNYPEASLRTTTVKEVIMNGAGRRLNVIHQSLVRPVLLAGAERPLAIANWITAAALILGGGKWETEIL